MTSSELPLDELTKSQVGVLCQVALLTSVCCCAATGLFTRLFATASARYKTEENVAMRRVNLVLCMWQTGQVLVTLFSVASAYRTGISGDYALNLLRAPVIIVNALVVLLCQVLFGSVLYEVSGRFKPTAVIYVLTVIAALFATIGLVYATTFTFDTSSSAFLKAWTSLVYSISMIEGLPISLLYALLGWCLYKKRYRDQEASKKIFRMFTMAVLILLGIGNARFIFRLCGAQYGGLLYAGVSTAALMLTAGIHPSLLIYFAMNLLRESAEMDGYVPADDELTAPILSQSGSYRLE